MKTPSTAFGTDVYATGRRYAIRVTGPAGHSRYLCDGDRESDDPKDAISYNDSSVAWWTAGEYQRSKWNVVCDVVNLDDPEDRCHE